MKGKMNLWLIVWIGLCTDADNIFLIFFWCVAPPTSFFSGVYRIAWKDKMDCPMFEERLFWMPAVNQDHALHKLHTQIRRPKLSKKKKKKDAVQSLFFPGFQKDQIRVSSYWVLFLVPCFRQNLTFKFYLLALTFQPKIFLLHFSCSSSLLLT